MSPTRRFLVVRLSSLGDVLHAVPAVRMLSASFPNSKIDWVVEDRFRYLVEAFPEIDQIHTIDTRAMRQTGTRAASYHSALSTLRRIRRRRYDCALDFQGLLKTALLTAGSGARLRCGFAGHLVREWPAHWFYDRRASAPGKPVHVTRLNEAVAALTGAVIPPGGPARIRVPEDARAHTEALLDSLKLRDFIVLNPGGGWHTKRWSPERFGMLARRILAELGRSVVVTTGPGEEALFARIRASAAVELHHLPVSFLELVPVMERSALVVGGDTGPFHLACLLERPVVGIFGPTAPVRNGPWDASEGVVARLLPCSFCNRRECPTANECMDIDVDEVMAAVIHRLSRQSKPALQEGP